MDRKVVILFFILNSIFSFKNCTQADPELDQVFNQTLNGDAKWKIVSDIKEILKNQVTLFELYGRKMKNSESLLSEIKTDLVNSDSNVLSVILDIDKKLSTQKFNCIPESYPTSCANFKTKYCSNNKCVLQNHFYGPAPFLVSCDHKSNDGGWTIIQRRIDGSVDFYRNWHDYKTGFGHIDREFFIGMDKLHALITTLGPVELLVQLRDFNGTMVYAKYDEFNIGSEDEKFKLIKVGKYEGNAGDYLSPHTGYSFSTKDRDNDVDSGSCAVTDKGAWWYHSCFHSALNGKYYNTLVTPKLDGIIWGYQTFGPGYRMIKYVQMAIRPRQLQQQPKQ